MYISKVKCFNSEFVHFMRTAFNPFMPNGISHCFQSELSISVLRDVRWYFVASDLSLHYLPMSHKKDARHIWVKIQLFCLHMYLIRDAEIWEVYC